MLTAGDELKSRSHADKTTHSCQHRQHRQRHPHVCRRFMRRVHAMLATGFANVLAWLVTRTIPGGKLFRVVRLQPFIKC